MIRNKPDNQETNVSRDTSLGFSDTERQLKMCCLIIEAGIGRAIYTEDGKIGKIKTLAYFPSH